MSTKIYNAYKIENMTMPEIMECLYEMKEDTKNNFKHFIKHQTNHEEILKNWDFVSFKEMLIDVNDKNINTPFNWKSSVVLYFHRDDIYIITFGVNLDLKKYFKDNLFDYHYQNQSDPWYCFDYDEDSYEYIEAEKEWEERGEIWDEIIGNRYSFSESGLSFDLFDINNSLSLVYELLIFIWEKKRNDDENN